VRFFVPKWAKNEQKVAVKISEISKTKQKIIEKNILFAVFVRFFCCQNLLYVI
jgi:hypothetical protein